MRVDRSRLFRSLGWAVILLGTASGGLAQALRTVTGTVVDSSGATIPGVVVVLEALDGRAVASGESDASGAFRIPGVMPGSFTLVASREGFASETIPVTVSPNDDPPLAAIAMRVAGVFEDVQVRVQVDRLRLGRDESPAAVRTIDRRTFAALPVRDNLAALALLPNVDVRRSGGPIGEGTLTSYGLSGQPLAPTANVVAFNGIPLNNGLLPETSLNLVPFNLVQRFEIVQGPGSSAYGSNAMTGVVNFATRRPETRLTGGVEATLASRWNTREFGAFVGGGRAGLHHWVIGGTSRVTDGHLQPGGREDFSDAAKTNLATVGERQLGATRLSAAAVFVDALEHNPDVRTPNRSTRLDVRRTHVNLGVSQSLGAATAVDVTYVHNGFRSRSRESFDLGVYGVGASASRPGDPSDQKAGSHGVIARTGWNTRLNALTAGVETHAVDLTNRLTGIVNSGTTRGFFVHDRYLAFAGRLALSAGYRYDKASTYRDASSSPKVGAVWKPVGGRWLVRGAVSRAFTAPTFAQLFSAGFVRGNAQLVAQTVSLKEVGGELRPSPGLALGVTVFRANLDHPIFPRFNPQLNATQFANVSPGSSNTGGSLTVDYQAGVWMVGGSYTYLDPGSATFHTWRHTAKGYVGVSRERWTAAADVRGQSSGYWADAFARPADDYVVMGIRATYRIAATTRIVFTGENLTDALYATTANIGNVAGVSNNTGIPRPGRFVALGVEVGF